MAFDQLRRLVYFLLGVALLIDAVVQAGANVPEMVVGLILLGLIPADALAARLTNPSRGNTAPPFK